MKKIIVLITVVSLLIPSITYAGGIDFFKGTWEEAKLKAKAENKTLFVDAYTVWCGPCKWMSKNIFPDDAVGAFYNANFISVKLDMEKEGDGLEFAQNYGVKAYPTLLYLDADGNLLHQGVGGKDAKAFIDLGKTALDADSRFENMADQYKDGRRDLKFIQKYIVAMGKSNIPSKEVVDWYFYTLPENEMFTKENFEIITFVVNDVKHPIFTKVINEQAKFETVVSKKEVNQYIQSRFYSIVIRAIYSGFGKGGKKGLSDDERMVAYNNALELVKTSGYKDYKLILNRAELNNKIVNGGFNTSYLPQADAIVKSQLWNSPMELGSIIGMVTARTELHNKKILQQLIEWSERNISLDKSSITLYTHAKILYLLGKDKSALKNLERAKESAKNEKFGKDSIPMIDKLISEISS